ncbi:MAG: hypothetical protein SFV54_28725 [Bryobacteraceae bacterium]|nr:hypothetical protein [Bryobacteraceae bacterium]
MALRSLPVLLLAVACAGAAVEETEKKIKMTDLPAAVQNAVKEQSKSAKLRGLSSEVKDGKTLYEAELRVNGKTRDVTFDETGKVVSVEQEVEISTAPHAVREALLKMAGKGKILRFEKVTAGDQVYYEADIRKDGKETEVKLDPAGRSIG